MTFLPVVQRELLIAARSSRTYWSRFLAAVLVLVASLVIFAVAGQFGRTRVNGHQVFTVLSWFAVLYCMFAGAALTSDAISAEKREETLGLLFLTDLKGYDVIVGKLLATSLRSFYGLLGALPIMAIPLLIGGVPFLEFTRIALALLNLLIFSLSAGLLVSTLFRSQKVTSHTASLAVLVWCLLPGAAGLIALRLGVPFGLSNPVWLSPLYSFVTASDAHYRTARVLEVSYEFSILAVFAISAATLAFSSWLLPRCWQTKSRQPRSSNDGGGGSNAGEEARKRGRRLELLNQGAYFWLAGRERFNASTLWSFLVILFVVAMAALIFGDGGEFKAVEAAGVLFIALVTRMVVAVSACQQITSDKQSGALDVLLTTPMTVADILLGQWRALRRWLAAPLTASLVLAWMFCVARDQEYLGSQEKLAVVFLYFALTVLSIADWLAIGWLAMWTGLHLKQPPHTAAVCLVRVVAVPGALSLALVWMLDAAHIDLLAQMNPFLLPGFWLAAGLVNDAVIIARARSSLLRHFREVAAEPYARRSRWRGLVAPRMPQGLLARGVELP